LRNPRPRMIAAEMPWHADREDRTRFCLDCPHRSTNDIMTRRLRHLIGLNLLQSLAQLAEASRDLQGGAVSPLRVPTMPFLCSGPALALPGGAVASEGARLPSAKCSIPVAQTIGDSRGSQTGPAWEDSDPTPPGNMLSTLNSTGVVAGRHSLGWTLGRFYIASTLHLLAYLGHPSRTSALLCPHQVRLALLKAQRLAPPARSPSPFAARIVSPHIGYRLVPPTLNTAIASTTLFPHSSLLFTLFLSCVLTFPQNLIPLLFVVPFCILACPNFLRLALAVHSLTA
jgi:hypothetical protein